jgi:hypothetical protein
MTVSAACIAFRVSRRWYYRLLPRWQAQGRAGLIDRSSRPHRSPQRLSLAQEAAIVTLRQHTARGADFLAALLGLPASTVHRVIRRQGLLRQRAERAPVVRYEYSAPGAMVHCDTKKLGRIVGGPGHRIHGDHSIQSRGVGWEVMHMAIDDATRLVYAEILGDEKARTTALFLVRAVRRFRKQGISVDRVLTTTAGPTGPTRGGASAESPGSAIAAPAPITPRPTARPSAGSRLPFVRASTSRCSTAASNAWPPSTSSSGGTTTTDLTAPTKGSRPALALLSCRRRECHQCPGGLQLARPAAARPSLNRVLGFRQTPSGRMPLTTEY